MTFHVIGIQVWSHEMRLNEIHNQKWFTGRWEPWLTSGFWQVGGVGVADYVERNPNREQLDEVVCKDDPRKGFSFVLNNFGLLLDDSFLQNLTEKICEGRSNTVLWVLDLILRKSYLLHCAFFTDKKCPTYTCPSKYLFENTKNWFVSF